MEREKMITKLMVAYNELNESLVGNYGEPPDPKYFNTEAIEALRFKTIEKMNMIVLQKLNGMSDEDIITEYAKVFKTTE